MIYSKSSDFQGRPCAVNVDFLGDRQSRKTQKRPGTLSLWIVACFLIIVGVSVVTGALSILFFGLYIVVSLITFLLYAKDKSAAKNGTWRTSESTLHFFSLIGGWPGAIVAQQALRHKSQKQSFRFMFWVTVLLNCSLFVWFFTPEGSKILDSVINSLNFLI